MSDVIYAIGDIHGHLEQLQRVHDLIATDKAKYQLEGANVVHIGDLVDRGPNSNGVIDFLKQGQENGQPWIVIKGNHDRLFHKFLSDPNWVDARLRADLYWLHPRMGGTATLASYGINADANRTMLELFTDSKDHIPAEHHGWLNALPLWFETAELLFVHAGIQPAVKITEQLEDDLLWIRNDFLTYPHPHAKMVVHGHTMVAAVEVHPNRINIDTGAGRGDRLSAIVVEGDQVWQLHSDGRRELSPRS